MRIILDTDKKTITVPWNYQAKLDEYNKMVMEISGMKQRKSRSKGILTRSGKSAWQIVTSV